MEFEEAAREDLTLAAKEGEKIKLFRKWAFTINCDLLKDGRLAEKSYYVEGHDLNSYVNNRNKTIRTTVWIGALEPAEAEKKDNYNHRHCAVESTGGGISKMNALTQIAKYLNIDCKLLTCGHGMVVSYSQPVQEWPSYKKYMFKILPGRMTSDEEKIQQAVIHLRRTLKKNPTATQVKEYLIQGNIIAFRKLATGAMKQMIDLACEIGDIYKSDSSEDGSPEREQDGMKLLSKLSKIDDNEIEFVESSGFFEDILEILVKQLKDTTRRNKGSPPLRAVFEVIAMMILPLFLKRNANDHKTRSLVLYGKSKTGKSFMPMQLVKMGKLHQIAFDAKGVGRFDAITTCNGFFFDDVKDDILKSSDAPTLKNLTAGDEARVKIYSNSSSVRGWVIITCQKELEREKEDEAAWDRRLLEINFEDCQPLQEYVTVFDLTKASNVEELLTFLYYVMHKPKLTMYTSTVLKDMFVDSKYYDQKISEMFDKIKYGDNLLRLLSAKVVKLEKMFE